MQIIFFEKYVLGQVQPGYAMSEYIIELFLIHTISMPTWSSTLKNVLFVFDWLISMWQMH